ncbi:SURF1 family protein [Pontixanthobacter sp.]|uniref:SURF1 family protein n=1 Tax=Pontixanthobacter sp. TaxID=2792078 RepID=UPI003C7B9BA7
MIRTVPIIPTLLVLLCAVIMVALGIWQLGRAEEKNALLARYQSISADAPAVPYPSGDAAMEAALYRTTMIDCPDIINIRSTAGTNAVGVKGWAHIAECALGGGRTAEVALGWSRNPNAPEWRGGTVTGILAPGGKIIADPALADLGPLAKPDPADLPNNHLAYAGQWFLFALTALIIYGAALRRRARLH